MISARAIRNLVLGFCENPVTHSDAPIMPMIDLEVPLRALFDRHRFLDPPTYTVVTNGMAGYMVFVKDSQWS